MNFTEIDTPFNIEDLINQDEADPEVVKRDIKKKFANFHNLALQDSYYWNILMKAAWMSKPIESISSQVAEILLEILGEVGAIISRIKNPKDQEFKIANLFKQGSLPVLMYFHSNIKTSKSTLNLELENEDGKRSKGNKDGSPMNKTTAQIFNRLVDVFQQVSKSEIVLDNRMNLHLLDCLFRYLRGGIPCEGLVNDSMSLLLKELIENELINRTDF